MFWLFRRFCTLLGFLVLCSVTLYLSRNFLAEWSLRWIVLHSTTFGLSVDRVNVDKSWPLKIELIGARITNPSDFATRTALYLPRAVIGFESTPWHQHTVQLSLLDLDISQFEVSLSYGGESNLHRFLSLAQQPSNSTLGFSIEAIIFRISDLRYQQVRVVRHITSEVKLAQAFSDILPPR